MDGLLLDTERLSEDSFRQASLLFDLSFDTELFSALTGQSGPAHRQILATHLPDEVDAINFDLHWKKIYHDSLSEVVPVKPMAAEFLQNIQETGVPLAVATSSHTDKASDQLTRAGLALFLDLITGGDQVSEAKPSPEIYQRVMTAFAVDAQQVLCLKIQIMVCGPGWPPVQKPYRSLTVCLPIRLFPLLLIITKQPVWRQSLATFRL